MAKDRIGRVCDGKEIYLCPVVILHFLIFFERSEFLSVSVSEPLFHLISSSREISTVKTDKPKNCHLTRVNVKFMQHEHKPSEMKLSQIV
jgi:hypothetical protein